MSQRYLALDVLRGLILALMIVVNTPGDWGTVYAPLLHAEWHGFTLTDLVFPSFLFVVGNAMSFALGKYETMGDRAVLHKLLTRSLLMFLLGFLLYWFPFFKADAAGNFAFAPLSHTRIPGVLQRIALCYLLASLVLHYWKTRGALIFSGVALLGYWAILAQFGDYTLAGNAAVKFDLLLLGENHLYHGEGIPFDPEGLLGTLPAIVNVIAGYLAGNFLRQSGNTRTTLIRLVAAGLICIVVALCWNTVFPINKKLWTSPYVLLSIGLDLLILPLLIYLIEFKKIVRWTYFFEVFGKNTLFIFLLSELLVIISFNIRIGAENGYGWLYRTCFQGLGQPYLASLLFALCFTLLCWLIGYWMDRRKIYIKL
ncbi:acyltransferase family protein [Janthinobacterium agaricidamnosum]|uniref:Putative membrane protein n=1 Tax=Janthinobacterium agaricidamnosum NBRC 102515 = DSM 9628 TaxID=1349767 RepID=W0VAV7_9BURK|nr:heparan-alpha-glucosaminide N-acetyltransferase domain-containing protein [Janthinobacterium agaricidamnosum]CDG84765.1 putative membrane protein [Janthinobacterium agaricidamnosum NBRC 102515 = DSM 9628]